MSDELESRLDELESLVEQQQTRIEEQAETIEDQQETIEDQQERLDWLDELDEELEAELDGSVEEFDEEEAPDGIDRRSAMKAGGLLALAGLGAGSAGANATGQVGTSSRPLQTVYSESVVSNLFDFEGTSMFLEAFDDNGTDTFAVSSDEFYAFIEPKFEVDRNGNTTVDGSLSVGGDGSEQRTAGPIAKGAINADGTIENAVNVSDATYQSSASRYKISFTDDTYADNEYATHITNTADNGIVWRTTGFNGDLLVFSDDQSQHAFTFVTHKIVSG